MSKAKPYVWVVELYEEDDQWEPVSAAGITRDVARAEMSECQEACPADRFRIVKYFRVESSLKYPFIRKEVLGLSILPTYTEPVNEDPGSGWVAIESADGGEVEHE